MGDDFKNKQGRSPVFSFFSDIIDSIGKTINLFDKISDRYETIEKIDEITYEDAIKYISQISQKDDRIKKSIIIRQIIGKKIMVIQSFLDTNNNIIMMPNGRALGRKMKANVIDNELASLFGTKDHVLLK